MTGADDQRAAPEPFRGRSAIVLFSLVLIALAIKLGYHRDHDTREPLAEVPYGDSVIYLEEAARIWGAPSATASSRASAAGTAAEGAPGVFYKPPLYTLLLSKFDGSTAAGRATVRRLQLVLSLLVLVMVFFMARARAGDAAAAAAFLLLLLYAPATFHESKLLDTVPGLFLAVFGCAALDRALRRGVGSGPLILIGVVFGLATLTRSANLLLVAAFVPFCPPLRGLRGLAMISGAVLIVLPVAYYNHAEGAGGFVPVNYSEGHTFLVGNNENARGMYTLPPGYPDGVVNERLVEREMAALALGREPSPAEQRDHSYGLGFAYLREHPERIAGLLLDKVRFAISSYEVDDNYSLTRERSRFGLLSWFVTPFSLLLALGIAGLLLPGFRGRAIVVMPVLLTFGLLLGFYVASRYRLMAAPFLAVAAAVGLRSFLRGGAPLRLRYIAIVAAVLMLPGWIGLPYARADLDRSQAMFDQVLDAHASEGLYRAGDSARAAATLAAGIADKAGGDGAPFLEDRLRQLLATVSADVRGEVIEAVRAAGAGAVAVERLLIPHEGS